MSALRRDDGVPDQSEGRQPVLGVSGVSEVPGDKKFCMSEYQSRTRPAIHPPRAGFSNLTARPYRHGPAGPLQNGSVHSRSVPNRSCHSFVPPSINLREWPSNTELPFGAGYCRLPSSRQVLIHLNP